MATAISANRAELLAIADAVAREKLIDREIVIEAMEELQHPLTMALHGLGILRQRRRGGRQ